MSSVIFSNAQRIISQIFQWLQTSGQGKTANLITDTFSSGIDNSTLSGEGFVIVPGTNNTSISPTVNCTLGGIAYDPTGARIFISSSDTTLYNASNPSATTNDGLGNFLPTPQSTGVVNIPVTQSSQNYIWIDYLATIDTTAFTLNKETEAKIFYKQTDGYNIQVTTTNVAPDANSIFLASVNMTGGGAVAPSNISQVGRTYFNILPNIVPITTAQAGTNPPDRTPAYAPASTYTLEAHIKAVGTGSGVSPTNPHNTSLSDLGIGPLDTVMGHRQLEHGVGGGLAAANAIIAGVPGTPSPTTSAMATSINIVNPGSDYLTVDQLLSTEFALINGTAYNVTSIFGAIPTNANVFFPNASGIYNVYYDSVVKAFSSSTSDISADVTKLWIASVTYTFVGTGPSDHNSLSSLTDRRRIGSSTHLLQRWLTNARPGSGSTAASSGEFGFNLSTNLLEYWDGSAWQQPVNTSANTTVPTGALLPFAGASAPAGFLMADGSSYLTATYPNLFAVIGYTYGGGGGNFNVPNMVNNVPIGAGSIAALGVAAGSTTSSSVTSSNGDHFHQLESTRTLSGFNYSAANVVAYTSGNPELHSISAGGGETIEVASSVTNTTGAHTHNDTTSTIQPVLGVSYIIKT